MKNQRSLLVSQGRRHLAPQNDQLVVELSAEQG
jgi:hypothetical protein